MVRDGLNPDDITPLLLASTSPRRRFLLREAGVPFDAVAPGGDAEDVAVAGKPEELVQRHALAKARSVAGDFAGRVILGADTVVVLDGAVLGKPSGEEEARAMLATLQGRTHDVYTGLALLDAASGRAETAAEKTAVTIRPLSAEEVDIYVATGEPLDKAGAYAVQGRGAFLVKRLDGDYFNVVGLPLYRLSVMLAAFGYRVFG